jgi:AcrR family transcriptional regulator
MSEAAKKTARRANRASVRGRGSARKAVQTYHHGDLKGALIGAARTIVETDGVDGFTLREAARAAGVSHGAPAHHFKDKTALLTELAVEAFEERLRLSEEAMERAGPEPMARLKACGMAHIEYLIRNPNMRDLCSRDGLIDRTDPAFLDVTQRMSANLIGLMQAVSGKTLKPEKDANPSTLLALVIVEGFASLVNHRVVLDHVPEAKRHAVAMATAAAMLDQLDGVFLKAG